MADLQLLGTRMEGSIFSIMILEDSSIPYQVIISNCFLEHLVDAL